MRSAVGADKPKYEQITVRMPPELKRWLRREAAIADTDMSNYIVGILALLSKGAKIVVFQEE